MRKPNIPFLMLGSKVVDKSAKEESDLKIRNDKKAHRSTEKHRITYRTKIDHTDELNGFDYYADRSMNR